MSPETRETPVHKPEEIISEALKKQTIQPEQLNGTLYDADAPNTLCFGGLAEDYEVTAVCEPITDERYLEYDRKASLRIVDNGESADTSGNVEAQIKLFDDAISDVKGIPGEMPNNWKQLLDPDEFKSPMILRFIAVAAYQEPMKWGQAERGVITECWFNNKKLEQRHYLRKKTIDDTKAYRKLQKIPLGSRGKGLESGEIVMHGFAEQKAKLYDKMREKDASGYASRIPLWHKVAVIDAIFSAGVTGKK